MRSPRWIWLGTAVALAAILPLIAPPRWVGALILATYYIVMAQSWNLVMGYTGLFSFAHDSFAGIGTSALLTFRLGLPVVFGPIVGAAAAGAAGCLVGILCLRLRGFYLVLVTWAVAVILETLVQTQHQLTGGMRGIEAPPLFQSLSLFPYYVLGVEL